MKPWELLELRERTARRRAEPGYEAPNFTILYNPKALADRIVHVLSQAQMQFISEADLQAQLLQVLEADGIPAKREVVLSDGNSRIDLLAGPVGIEVKTNGSRVDVIRQLTRYAHCDEVDQLILVTTRTRHHKLPPTVADVPLQLVSLVGASL